MSDQESIASDAHGEDVSEAIRPVDYSAWIDAILMVAKHYRLECSSESVRLASAWSKGKPMGDVLRSMARQAGMTLKVDSFDVSRLTSWRLPVVVQFQDGQVAVIETLGSDGEFGISYSGDQGLKSTIDRKTLADGVSTLAILRPAKAVPDARVDDYIKPYDRHWLRKIVLRDLKPYAHVMLASLIANTLALAGILFTRQVYDRVIPAESLPTLYVLFSGVVVAIIFDFIMRRMRVNVTDLLGKRADMRLSDQVFGHALRIKSSAKARSTGAFISQIRELEQVRNLLTSTTVTAVADLPFFLLFCLVLWFIAGSLVLVPIGALALMIIPGLLAQRKLKRLAIESQRESSLRSAMLVESIQGLEDIKTLQAEQRFQQQWNHYNEVTADANLKIRYITNSLTVWTHNVQTGVFATVVLFGAPMVMASDLTTGSLVAASILASRMMSPMSQITQVLSRWQSAKVAVDSLNQIMERPVDNPEAEKKVHRPLVTGNYQFQGATFAYGEDAKVPALTVKSLHISPGEKIAILGRNGAGKSTLLQACSGLLEPSVGEVLLDGVSLSHIDPADVRRDIGLLTQHARLFHGSIRDNLTLGAPDTTDQEMLSALAMTGALSFVQRLPDGLDHVVMEGGAGLSGGQTQSLLLSRLLIRQPHVVLLDEPTASLDESTEKEFIQHFGTWLEGKTLLLATHRMSVLSLVDRIVVIDAGRIVMDDTKESVLSRLTGRSAKSSRP